MLRAQILGCIVFALMSFPCYSAESSDLQAPLGQRLKGAQADLKKIREDPDSPKSPDQARSVEEAKTIARVEAMLNEADSQIEKMASEREQLRTQRDELKQVQAQLASGLVGAIVTAIVAIAGALLTALNSKPERDLKRLTVIEKANELSKSGIQVPEDIASKYVPSNRATG
ncbi:hypothetical protein [Propionivibrio sp.]|uniref:hypothetical protein n=1 Tax=Propionivibrio sp. TaxID=2212460 RepID=UPI0025DB0473|nr:hypothetical protein [Propionivibrio sp.]MBK8401436.1 hypothetical protein [Propionivibrio sp.]MBK8745359.1 hypothetical protein [Propionivibrio sp.]